MYFLDVAEPTILFVHFILLIINPCVFPRVFTDNVLIMKILCPRHDQCFYLRDTMFFLFFVCGKTVNLVSAVLSMSAIACLRVLFFVCVCVVSTFCDV